MSRTTDKPPSGNSGRSGPAPFFFSGEKRIGIASSLMLMAVAVAFLSLGWLVRSEHDAFVEGEPAPRTYMAHFEMKFVDETATKRLQERKSLDVGGVLVRDPEIIESIRSDLDAIQRGRYSGVVSEPLSDLLDGMPEQERLVILSATYRAGEVIAEDPRPQYAESGLLWEALERSGLSLPQKNVAYQILENLLKPAYVVDNEATREYRDEVVSRVQPVEKRFDVGDVIVRRGERVTPSSASMLKAQGYAERKYPWRRAVLAGLAAAAWTFWMFWYVRRRDIHLARREWIFVFTILVTSWAMQLATSLLGGDGIGVLSLAVWSFLTLPGTFSFHLVLGGGVLGALIGAGTSLVDLVLLAFVSGMGAVLGFVILRNVDSRTSLFKKLIFLAFGLCFSASLLRWGIYLPFEPCDMIPMCALSAGLGVGVALLLLPVWERIFDVLTPTRLIDLSHPSHPLLKRLQIEAPGTYHHSLMVGTLAESAAEKLGLNALLVKAGAYFHDVGKLRRPHFFVENQQTGRNPHDELAPTMSALVILSHVREGVEIARRFNLPGRIRDFIMEHHGTTCLGYFLKKARQSDPALPGDQFCYPGPRPGSRETALVMLADSVEAAVRAGGASITDVNDIEDVVSDVIETKIRESQLDDVRLTLEDVAVIRATFMQTLTHMHHSRRVSAVQEDNGRKSGRDNDIEGDS